MSENAYTLSSRKRRIAAFLIDHFAMTFLIVSIVFLSVGTNFIDENNISDFATRMLPALIFGCLLYVSKDAIKGVSIGKWIMGIMVRDEINPTEVPSFGRLFIRNLFIIIWPIEFIVLAASQDKKRLGDKVAKTIVVKNPSKPAKLPRALALLGIGIAFCAFTFLFAGSTMKNSEAYKVAIENIEQNKEIVAKTGGIKEYGLMPTGSINISNGYGKAQLEIKVIGNRKDANVTAYLTKEPLGEWTLIELDNKY